MSVLQITYRSTGESSLQESDVMDILRSSQTRNQRDRISGLLIYRAPQFVQMLEGPEGAVLALYDRIAAPRGAILFAGARPHCQCNARATEP